MAAEKVTLPKLDYGYDELEPVLSQQLVTIHHTLSSPKLC